MTGANIKNIILAVCAAIGGFFVEFLGGVDGALKVLIIFMLVDYITGLAVAFVFHKSTKTTSGGASSKEGFKGIVKKLCIIMLVGLAHEIDVIMGVEYMRATAMLFFIGNEGLSVLENVGLMGVNYPEFLKKALEVMRDKGEKKIQNAECGMRSDKGEEL